MARVRDRLAEAQERDDVVRVVLKAYVRAGSDVTHTPDEGTRTLLQIWGFCPIGVNYVVVEYRHAFYTINLDALGIDKQAYIHATDYTVHDDLDAAIMAAILKTIGKAPHPMIALLRNCWGRMSWRVNGREDNG